MNRKVYLCYLEDDDGFYIEHDEMGVSDYDVVFYLEIPEKTLKKSSPKIYKYKLDNEVKKVNK